MRDFGGMLSFELEGGAEAAAAFLKGLRLWTLGESLGSVKSLLCQPATMTHASVEPEVRREAGIEDGLLRLSVGIEEADDLIADLAQALDAVSGVTSLRESARRTARTA
jgi:cystathionine beta-lyase/cystathionine gamma-synthase